MNKSGSFSSKFILITSFLMMCFIAQKLDRFRKNNHKDSKIIAQNKNEKTHKKNLELREEYESRINQANLQKDKLEREKISETMQIEKKYKKNKERNNLALYNMQQEMKRINNKYKKLQKPYNQIILALQIELQNGIKETYGNQNKQDQDSEDTEDEKGLNQLELLEQYEKTTQKLIEDHQKLEMKLHSDWINLTNQRANDFEKIRARLSFSRIKDKKASNIKYYQDVNHVITKYAKKEKILAEKKKRVEIEFENKRNDAISALMKNLREL